jgi:conjugal transfer pilus assembly protein TraB
MQEQLKALGVKPAVSGGEPAPPSPPPGPEGEPQPANYPPQPAQRYRLRRHSIRVMV